MYIKHHVQAHLLYTHVHPYTNTNTYTCILLIYDRLETMQWSLAVYNGQFLGVK